MGEQQEPLHSAGASRSSSVGSHPATSAVTAAATGSTGPLRWWRGPLLFVLGLGLLHVAINVPKSEMVERTDSSKKKPKPKGKHREAAQFDEQRRDEGFARIHEPVMTFAYELAHEAALAQDETAPQSMLESVECHRWRCQYDLCGPRRQLTRVVRVLKTLEHEDDRLFDAFEIDAHSSPTKGETCQRITIRFSRPSPEIKGIRASKATLEKLRRSSVAKPKVSKPAKKNKAAKAVDAKLLDQAGQKASSAKPAD